MDWEKEIISDWDLSTKSNEFVKKHCSSDKIFDFTQQNSTNEVMRFEIVKSLNLKIPNKNESTFLVTTKAISLLDVVNYIESKKGNIKSAFIFLYTVNDKAANYISHLSLKSDLKIIISDLMNSKREKERIITRVFDKNNVEIVFCHNHAKIVAININDDYFVLSGSMNAGNNARIESLHIINSKEMFNFVENIYNEFRNKFSISKRY